MFVKNAKIYRKNDWFNCASMILYKWKIVNLLD